MFIFIQGCVSYSFTGAAISNDVKTVSIDFFQNYAKQNQPTLSQVFTEKLKDVFISQTTLNLTSSLGDLQLSGSIKKYEINPINITKNSTTQNRLSISVETKFINTKNNDANFEKTFTRFADFDSNLSLYSIENELIEEITNQITQDIFNESVVNW